MTMTMMPLRTLKVVLLVASATISLQVLADTTTYTHHKLVDCIDSNDSCASWAEEGECTANPKFMKEACTKSCDLCEEKEEEEEFDQEIYWRKAQDLGVAQKLVGEDGTKKEDVQWIIQKSRNYMRQVVPDMFEEGMASICKNTHEMCSIWAMQGECDNNAAYMLPDCAPSCGSCEALTVEGRCPIDENAFNAWGPGDLNKMFERLTAEPYLSKYSVEILSSPETDDPWVITMENVVSEVEAARLIELGGVEGYERSGDVGAMRPDGTFEQLINEGRTSTNAWCNNECWEDPVGQAVAYRLSNLTDIPDVHSEHIQLLKYEVGQFYGIHHDYIPTQYTRQSGVRILTAYLYLSDVEAGGGTNFDKLNITVMPKRGRVLLWPSVLDEEPDDDDERTSHQALPVEAGVKFGANAWFHMRDFKTPSEMHCT